MRSAESIAFEGVWTAAKSGPRVPARSAIDLRSFAKFAPNMAIIEPDPSSLSLLFRLCGSSFFDLFGFDLTGMNYLDLVDPAIKESAHSYVMACLRQPCGLWQRTPVQVDKGELAQFEYTILPIIKSSAGVDHIMVYVVREVRPDGSSPAVKRIEHSTVWQWLDLGFGTPALEITERAF
ncbi:MAG TPA: PAS domain-containing protein [Parvibaculum sp.]